MAEVTTAPPGAASCHHVPFGMVVEVGDTNEAVVHACTCPVCLDLALSPAAGSPFSGDESFPFWFESDDDDYEHTPEMLSPDTLHGLSLHDDVDRAVSMKGKYCTNFVLLELSACKHKKHTSSSSIFLFLLNDSLSFVGSSSTIR